MAPGSIADHFRLAFEAFNYADKFQTPVIILNDKFLANSTQSMLPLREEGMAIDRGRMATERELEEAMAGGNGFPRFRPDPETVVSPRPLPGQPGSPYWMTGDEHDDYGHITENPVSRRIMHEKRMAKYKLMLEQIPEESQYSLHGEPDAEVTLVCWGSTLSILLDALPALKERGIQANFLNIRMLQPFPSAAVGKILKKAKKLILVENNFGAQLGLLVRMHTSIHIPAQIVKYTGRPMSLNEVVDSVEKILNKDVPAVMDPLSAEPVERVVLTYGL